MAVFPPQTPAQSLAMKILIILATALLVPVLMKFQERTLLTQSNPKTEGQVMKILEESGVGSPQASVKYLQATIGGMVESEEKAKSLVQKVGDLRGVSEVKNRLVVEGWFRLARSSKGLIASGVVTPDWKTEVLAGQPDLDVTQLKTPGQLQLAGRSSVSWALFIDQFFQIKGTKRLTFMGQTLTAEGQALPSEVVLLEEASRTLGGDVIFASRIVEQPSYFHFKGRSLDSPIAGESLRRLTRQITDQRVSYEQGKSIPTGAGREILNGLAATLNEFPDEVVFILGCYPDEGGLDLASQRAQQAKDFFIKGGVSAKRLRLITFEATENGDEFSGQVELLIR